MAACGGTPEKKEPEMTCCPKGALPDSYDRNKYKPKGELITLGGEAKNIYTVGDTCWGAAIIVFHDVYGAASGDHKAFCDALAANGYYVVLPDFFKGGSVRQFYDPETKVPVLEKPEAVKWLAQWSWKHVGGILDEVYKHLDEKKIGAKQIGGAGFCWGAWAVAKACQTPKLSAGVWYHPSLVVEKGIFAGDDEHEMTKKLCAPTLNLPSKNEPDFYSNGELTKIMDAIPIANKTVKFKNMTHGWMVRGAGFLGVDYKDGPNFTTDQRSQFIGVQRGVNMALGWFADHLYPNGS